MQEHCTQVLACHTKPVNTTEQFRADNSVHVNEHAHNIEHLSNFFCSIVSQVAIVHHVQRAWLERVRDDDYGCIIERVHGDTWLVSQFMIVSLKLNMLNFVSKILTMQQLQQRQQKTGTISPNPKPRHVARVVDGMVWRGVDRTKTLQLTPARNHIRIHVPGHVKEHATSTQLETALFVTLLLNCKVLLLVASWRSAARGRRKRLIRSLFPVQGSGSLAVWTSAAG